MMLLSIALYILAMPFAGVTYLYIVESEQAHTNWLHAIAFMAFWPCAALILSLWMIYNWMQS
jgi:hypothetical protein